MHSSAQFLADHDLLTVAMISSEQGAFSPHIPNNSDVCRQFLCGDIFGTGTLVMAQSFITNEAALEELTATTAKRRPHTQAEKDKIRRELRKGLAAR